MCIALLRCRKTSHPLDRETVRRLTYGLFRGQQTNNSPAREKRFGSLHTAGSISGPDPIGRAMAEVRIVRRRVLSIQISVDGE